MQEIQKLTMLLQLKLNVTCCMHACMHSFAHVCLFVCFAPQAICNILLANWKATNARPMSVDLHLDMKIVTLLNMPK